MNKPLKLTRTPQPTLEEVPDLLDFLVVPSQPIFSVNKVGDVKNSYTGNLLAKSINPDGYVRVDASFKYQRFNNSAHRLVAEVFVPHSFSSITGHEVNHKDGVKDNNVFTNLEWTTGLDNKIHAWENGLIKTTPCVAMNLKTGEITRFSMLRDLALFLDLSKGLVLGIVNGPTAGKRLRRGFVFKKDDDSPWPDSEQIDTHDKWDFGLFYTVLHSNGGVETFFSRNAMCFKYQISPNRIPTLPGEIKAKEMRVIVSFAEYSEEIKIIRKTLQKNSGPFQIRITDTTNNETVEVRGSSEASLITNISSCMILYFLKRNEGSFVLNNWLVEKIS